jgi:predicted RNase H-like HicB family nuclease
MTARPGSPICIEFYATIRGRAEDEGGVGGVLEEPPSCRISAIEAEVEQMRRLKIIVEEHSDLFVAYPLGVKGVVVGQGDSSEDALADVKSAIRFHIESFGAESFDASAEILNAQLPETELAD